MGSAPTQDLFGELEARLAGRVIRPASEGYDAARAIHNGMINRRPSAIAQCTGTADVLEAVNFARKHGGPATVRAGGHSAAGHCVHDDALMIDLSGMKGVHVDPARRTARAGAGVLLGEFDRETQVYGLATTMGTVRATGIAGLTLGGGVGWLSRRFGFACDNLISADVVTADGRVLRASETENPDLLWGLRGGGGNFGIVTSFEYRLHEVGTVVGGLLGHPRERARDVYRFHRDFMRSAPDEITAHVAQLTTPDGHPATGIALCYSGALEDADRTLGPLRKFGPPIMDMVGPMPYCQVQSMLDPMMPPGLRNYWTGGYIDTLTDAAIDTLVEAVGTIPSPYSAVVLEHHGGASARIAPDATAFPHRSAECLLVIVGLWKDPAEDEVNKNWARGLWKAMEPYSSGAAYANLLGSDDSGRTRGAYGPNYEKLAALKKKYDPENFFRHNMNIAPAV
jgi:FAD/FMN-containing dehydrogenase